MALTELYNITITQALKWLISPSSPVKISLGVMLRNLSWIRRFMKIEDENYSVYLETLRNLGKYSMTVLTEVIEREKIECNMIKNGVIEAYSNHANLEEAWEDAKHKLGKDDIEYLGKDELPKFLQNLAGGILYKRDACLSPDLLIEKLTEILKSNNVEIMQNTKINKILIKDNRSIQGVVSVGDGMIYADNVVITAGPWSGLLLKQLKIPLALMPAKGYALITRLKDGVEINIPVMFEEYGVALNPSRSPYIRITGFFELFGFDKTIRDNRIEAIFNIASNHVKGIADSEIVEKAAALRPCPANRIPIITRHNKIQGLYIATGHCRLGMTFAAGTGDIVSRLVSGDGLPFDISVFSLS